MKKIFLMLMLLAMITPVHALETNTSGTTLILYQTNDAANLLLVNTNLVSVRNRLDAMYSGGSVPLAETLYLYSNNLEQVGAIIGDGSANFSGFADIDITGDQTVGGTMDITGTLDAGSIDENGTNLLDYIDSNYVDITGALTTQAVLVVDMVNVMSTQVINTAGIAANLVTGGVNSAAIDLNASTGSVNTAAIVDINSNVFFKADASYDLGDKDLSGVAIFTADNGTFTGNFTVDGNTYVQTPTVPSNATDKAYVDGVDATKYTLAGDTLTGPLDGGGQITTNMGNYIQESCWIVGTNSHAEGKQTSVINNNSHAEGFNSQASGFVSHAEGNGTAASGNYSHSEGGNTGASGDYSHAEGRSSGASGNYSHAAGYNATAGHESSFVWSDGTTYGSTATKQFSSYAENGFRFDGGAVTANGTNILGTAVAAQETADAALPTAGGTISGDLVVGGDLVLSGNLIMPFDKGIIWMASNELATYTSATNYVKVMGTSATNVTFNFEYEGISSNVSANLVGE